MRTILISLILAGIASAQVPSLINYQGRLTNAEGEPLTGTKNFELKIFDSQTDGNLLYTEDVGAIQLGEGGVYSFQFGGTGTSNTQVTEIVGTGNGENLYQKILSNTPVVEGSVSVSDGTYTWSQESGSSNEDDFSASFSKNLSRITVNYFAGGPDDGRQIEVTYRYGAEGIVGALSSGAEHWLQLSIDGQVQATRERVLAVPFALRAGVADTLKGEDKILSRLFLQGANYTTKERLMPLDPDVGVITRIRTITVVDNGAVFRIHKIPKNSQGLPSINSDSLAIVFSMSVHRPSVGDYADSDDLNLLLDHEKNYYGCMIKVNQGSGYKTPGDLEIFYLKK